MATSWVEETGARAHQRAHDVLYPRKDLTSALTGRRRGVEGPRHFTESKKDGSLSRSPSIAARRVSALPSSSSSSTLRRSSSGMLYRMSSDGTLSRVQSRDPMPRVQSSTRIEQADDDVAAPIEFVTQRRAAPAPFAMKDLTLNVVTQRTEAMLQLQRQQQRGGATQAADRSRTPSPSQRHRDSDEYKYDGFEPDTDGDRGPAADNDNDYDDDDDDGNNDDDNDLLQTKAGPKSFRHLFEVVFRRDIVALVGAFAAERFKRFKREQLPSPSPQHSPAHHRGSMANAAMAAVVATATATEGADDGSAATPNTRRIRDEKKWADGVGELYLEIAAALLANKELRDLILTAEEFQKIVAEEQAHVSLLQNHRTTPQSVFRHALEFFDRLPPTSKFLQGCVCVALSKCPPVATVLEIYDKQWRALTQGDRRRSSLFQLAAAQPRALPPTAFAGTKLATPDNGNGNDHDHDHDDDDAAAGIEDDDGESGDDDNRIDDLLLLPQFQKRKVTLAEKIADLPVAENAPPAKVPDPALERRARKPTLRPASGRDLLAKTYERSLRDLASSTKEKKRPISSFGASTRVVWPTREWKVKKFDDFSFLSYSAGPAPGQEYLERARQFELRVPIVRQSSSARKSSRAQGPNSFSPATPGDGFGVAPRQRLGDSPRARRPSTVSGIASRIASARRLEVQRSPSQRGSMSRQTSVAGLQTAHSMRHLQQQQSGGSFATEGAPPRPFTSPAAAGRGPFLLQREESTERMRVLALEVLKEEDDDAKLRRVTKGWDTRFWWKHDAFALSDDKRNKSGSSSSPGKRNGTNKKGRSRSNSPHPPHVYRSAPPGLAPPEEQVPPVKRVPVLKLLFQSFLRELVVQTLAPPPSAPVAAMPPGARPQSAFPVLVNRSPKQ